jgi:hypothetical protein
MSALRASKLLFWIRFLQRFRTSGAYKFAQKKLCKLHFEFYQVFNKLGTKTHLFSSSQHLSNGICIKDTNL